MIQFKVDVDNLEVKAKLNRVQKKNPQLSRLILGRLSEAVISQSVKEYLSGQALKRRSGTLAKSLTYKMLNDWRSEVGSNLAYAAIHEFGGIIEAKNADYLHFKAEDDEWVVVKKVKIPKRPWLAPAIQDVFNTSRAPLIMNNATDEWLAREWYK